MSSLLDDPDVITVAEAVKRIGRSSRTLYGWREDGKGPRFLRYGGRIYYRISWIEDWRQSGENGSR